MFSHVYLCLSMLLCVRSVFEEYTRQYQSLKGLRTLEWKPPVGLIDLEIELGDEVKQFCVSPARAVIALLFQDKGEHHTGSWLAHDLIHCSSMCACTFVCICRLTLEYTHIDVHTYTFVLVMLFCTLCLSGTDSQWVRPLLFMQFPSS